MNKSMVEVGDDGDDGVADLMRDVARFFESDSGDITAEGFRSLLTSIAEPSNRVIRPMDRHGTVGLPLSFAQQRLWFLDRLAPDSHEYLIPVILRLRGCLDMAALRTALDGLVARHEPLRTVFDDVEGVAVQIIREPAPFPLELLDLTVPGNETDLDEILSAETSSPMDLRRGPLVRGVLAVVGADDFVLSLTLHHIVADGWSFGVLTREFRELYAAAVEGRTAGLDVLPVQYADFAVWQRERLQGDVLVEQLDFWSAALTGLEPLELPSDRARPAVRSGTGQVVAFDVPADVTAGLRRLAIAADASLFMVLLAVFQVLLSRYSGQSDVAVGSPVANRGRAEIEGLIGFFVNTLVLRSDLSGDPSFEDFMAGVRDRVLDALGHQDLPFERLVEELAPERDLGRNPFFDVMLVLHNAETGEWELPGIRVQSVPVDSSVAKFDLTLNVVEEDGGLGARLVYSTDLFDRSTIERMTGHLLSLFASVAADSSVRLSELEMLTAGERRQLAEWNETDVEFPRDMCVHELVQRRAAVDPDAVAAVFGSESLTYGELNGQANQLARYLARRGARPGVVVGVCVERSLDLVVALLGVLKAGAAYVPLDPDYPAERLAFMLSDTAAPIIVTQGAVRGRVTSGDVVVLDEDRAVIDSMPDTDPVTDVRPDDLAYVIYTSGSTGEPKGVQVEHRSLVNLTVAVSADHGIDQDSRLLQFASMNFDVSVWEIFSTLVVGATLILASPADLLPGITLESTIADHGVTVLGLAASLLTRIPADGTACLKTLCVGGEVVSAQVLADHAASTTLINAYGLTETTVCATLHRQKGGVDGTRIGRPVANTKAYVVDGFDRLVPIGVPGELLIGGVGVARGYLNRPELTERRFAVDPFSSGPSARVYRTGDLVRWRPEGYLEFVGRLDDQVKVRGFRIELGEVESVLIGNPDLASCVVTVREDVPGDRRLVAYCVPVDGRGPGVTGLREWCERSLPGYMVPSGFMFMDALPLTVSGKVDRRALPVPDSTRPELDGGFSAPRHALEGAVAGVWREVLGIDRVGIHDNFFALGGDSILSIQVVARLKGLGVDVTPRMVFQHQTVAGLVAAAGVAGAVAPVVAEQGKVTGVVALSPVQQWFFEWGIVEPSHFNQSAMLVVDGLDVGVLRSAVAAVADHHDMLRARFTCDASGWTQHIGDEAGDEVVSECDLSGATDVDVALRELADEAQRSLDLTTGPVLRVVLVELGAGRGRRLLVVVHHLVVDGVSWRVLLEDLGRVCAGKSLPPKTTPFREWSARLAEHAKSVDIDYWNRELPVVPVPRDGVGANSISSVRIIEARWGADQTNVLLRDVARVFGTGINAALLMAVAWAFREWTGESVCAVELEGHGREDVFDGVDVSRTVGWFTSIFPVVIDLGLATDPVECVKIVAAHLNKVPDKGLGYGIGRYLGGMIRPQDTPQISFNYLGQYDGRVPGLGRYTDSTEPTGDPIDPAAIRKHVLDITADVRDGRLRFAVRYSTDLHERPTVQRFVDMVLAVLGRLVGTAGREGDRHRLAPLQTGMLFHSLTGDSPDRPYVLQSADEYTGPLDLAVFRQVWQRIVDRHSALRSGFVWEGLAEPLQVVRRSVEVPFVELDWSGCDAEDVAQRLDGFLHEDRAVGFDLSRAPLLRFTLIRLAPGRVLVVSSSHHLIMDGWSLQLLTREFIALYRAATDGVDASLAAPVSFADYVQWLNQQPIVDAEGFWRRALSGIDSPTDLTVARDTGRSGFDSVVVWADRDSALRLRNFARGRRLTVNTIVQAAWALLLSRYSGDDRVLYGTTVSGRPAGLPGVESVVGSLINTVPVPVDVPPDTTVSEWLGAVQDRLSEVRQFEHCSLVDVQGWSDIPRGTRLFKSILVFENYPSVGSAAELPHGITRERRKAVEWQDYPMSVVTHLGETFTARFTYDLGLFDPATVHRMAGHFLTLLASMISDPAARLRDLEMLTTAERRQLLFEWNDTAAEFPRDARVHELVQRHESAATAVTFGSESLTYGQLNARANQLARFLVGRGVGPGAVVGVCLPRSLELAVALLGVLKAGAAYVPLDPGYPAPRLAFMLSDTAAATVLTHSAVRFLVPTADVVVMDEDWPAISGVPDTDLAAEVRPDDLAYVIYTSGSTGEPKGVEVRHESIVSLGINGDYMTVVAGDVFLQLAPASFDAATFEIWVPLINGATVAMVPPGVPDPLVLAQEIRRTNATVAWLTAGLFRAVVDVDPEILAGLRHVLAGGDVLSPSHVDRFRRALPGTRLTNGYGPTENTTFTCCADLTDTPYGLASVPIGRPIANTTVYVVDRRDRLVPIGVPGELLVGGVGVAGGYRNRPELTEERFTADPFSADPAVRVYRTGDIVRWLPDGALDFVGRLDDQVKIRGFRIEPGEVESVLAGHPDVASCVVTVREDKPGDKRLVAYCVPIGAVNAPALREWCERSLPGYLVPNAFVLLDVLPLTANGKVDRRALPAPDSGHPELATGYVPPRDPAEQAVARTWCEVLGVDQVGIHDNFFELGGDSILCIQVITRLKKFGIQVTPRLLFQHATVAELVVAARASAPMVVEQGRVTGNAALSPVQRWFFEGGTARPDRFNQAVMVAARGLAQDALESAVAALVDHHDMLRARFTREPHGWAQHIADSAETVVRTHDLSAEPDAWHVIRTLADEAHRGLDLAAGPLLRSVLFDLGPDRGQRLLIVVHHLATDGVSWRILLDDLAHAYEQVAAGHSILLPAKTTSFSAWSARLEQYAGSAACLAELPYWNRSRPATRLPRDGDGVNTFAAVRTVTAALGPEQTAVLLRDVPRAFDTRINDALLTALACALYDWTGQTACVIDMEGHGREDLFADVDLSRTVGWFTSIFPVVIDVGSAVDVTECLSKVAAQLGAVPNKGIGYGILRYAGSDAVRRQLGAQETPAISFNYLGQHDDEVPGLGRYADATEPSGDPVDPATTRRHLIDIRCVVRDGDLVVHLDYVPSLHDAATIEQLAARLLDHLRALTAAGGSTTRFAADFPLSGLDDAALSAVLERFAE